MNDDEISAIQICVRFRRKAASQYLKEKWGLSYQPSTLGKMACVGGGPKFQTANRIPYYPKAELDAWASSLLSPLRSSTSDRGCDPARTTIFDP